MSYYTNFVEDFKNVRPEAQTAKSKRDMKIWDMLLNRMGIPETLHEPVRAIFVAEDWSDVNFKQLTIAKMASNATTNDEDYKRVYNRLKKSIPKFFEWQSQQKYLLISREIIHERAQKYKTKAQYRFHIHDEIVNLFALPINTSFFKIKNAIEALLSIIPIGDPIPPKEKRIRPETLARNYDISFRELVKQTGSGHVASVYIREASSQETIEAMITSLKAASDD